MKCWKLLGEYDAETTTFSALAGGGGSSPYSPDISGRIKAFKSIVSRDAATTLTNHVEFRLKCSLWPIDAEVGAEGSGLQTAPALQNMGMLWPVDLPIKTGVNITMEARNITADTPVTNNVLLYALIEF